MSEALGVIVERRIATVLDSYYFKWANVLVTECGHRHLRPVGMFKVDDVMACPFCEERDEFPVDPSAPKVDVDE